MVAIARDAEKTNNKVVEAAIHVQSLIGQLSQASNELVNATGETAGALARLTANAEDKTGCDPPATSTKAGRLPITNPPTSAVLVIAVSAAFAGLGAYAYAAGGRDQPVVCTTALGVDMKQTHHPDADKACKQAAELQREGRFSEAAVAWAAAKGAGTDPAVCLSELAYCQYAAGHYPAALTACDELERVDPTSGFANYHRGLVYEKQGKTDLAKNEFRLAMMAGNEYAKVRLSHPPKAE